jgi:FkbM family methyltransferase
MIREYVKLALEQALRNYEYTVQSGIVKGLRRKGGFGFLPRRTTLSKEERFLCSLDLRGQAVYDIGGLFGVYTLFFAHAVGPQGRVVTFEPNPDNYQKIVDNVRINGFTHVDVLNVGVGERREMLTMVVPKFKPGRGSVDASISAYNRSLKGSKTLQIEVDRLDDLVTQRLLPPPDLIKIDIEGLEIPALRGMCRLLTEVKPRLFIETHGVDERERTQNSVELVAMLIAMGYAVEHVEWGQSVTNTNAHLASKGHLYCAQGLDRAIAR